MLRTLKISEIRYLWWQYPVISLAVIYLSYWIVNSPIASVAILVGAAAAISCLALIAKNQEEQAFLIRIFLIGLLLRWAVSILLYNTPSLHFIVLDSDTYDIRGFELCRVWSGERTPDSWIRSITNINSSGWGMSYFVGALYYVVGRNRLAVQLVIGCLGVYSAIVIYKVVRMLIPQRNIARVAAILVAFSPSMILWSSEILKDGLIVLCLSLSTLYTLKLREKFRIVNALILLLFLFSLFSLRHYAFYILFVSIAGGMIIGAKNFSYLRILQGGIFILLLGFLFTYLGAKDVAERNFDLKRIQNARVWSAKTANSGYGAEVDITDTKAALTFLPIGMVYVLLAPFPWMIGAKQLVLLPELILWWLSIPFLIKGFWCVVRHHLRESLALCLFTIGLTLVYALYQSNVGTAYRHRSQLYIFFFIFISIGWELRRNAKLLKQAEKARRYAQIRNRHAEASA